MSKKSEAQQRYYLRLQWLHTGHLYGDSFEENERRALMDELIDEFGPPRNPTLRELGNPEMVEPDLDSPSVLPDFYGDVHEGWCPHCQGRGMVVLRGNVALQQCPHCEGTGRSDRKPTSTGTSDTDNT